MDFFANIFGKPSSPASPVESKKPRRSERVRGKEDQKTHSQTTELAKIVSTMSPPSRPEVQRTPASSPSPQETQTSTQVASQFVYPFQHEEEEYDPNIWGYLDPITDPSKKKSIKLDKTPQCANDNKRRKSKASVKKTTASGFLIGRHPECDLHIEAAVISNRHCVIYKVPPIHHTSRIMY
jgi:serine/threonine-protein kinase Chk2